MALGKGFYTIDFWSFLMYHYKKSVETPIGSLRQFWRTAMSRKIALSLAGIAVGVLLSFTSAPAIAYDQGGVIPCSADDYRFVQGRRGGWKSNCGHRSNVGRHHAHREVHYGNQRRVHRKREVRRFRHTGRLLVYRGSAVHRSDPVVNHRGYERVVSRPVFRAPEPRGVPVSYERSTTGGCNPGFRLVAATGECI